MAAGRIAIGVDVGGSGIKAAVVDVESGAIRSDRLRVPKPVPSTPDAVNASIARLVKRLVTATGLGPATPVGVGLPGVTIDGNVRTASNIDPSWLDFAERDRLSRMLLRPVAIVNGTLGGGGSDARVKNNRKESA